MMNEYDREVGKTEDQGVRCDGGGGVGSERRLM